MGEGEERIYNLLMTLQRGEEVSIQGVLGKIEDKELLRSNKKAPITYISDLDELPHPAYDMVNVDRYLELSRKGFSPRPFEKGERVSGHIFGRVKGGFTVDISGAIAFLPGSQVDVRPVRDAGSLMGTNQAFQILKMDRR